MSCIWSFQLAPALVLELQRTHEQELGWTLELGQELELEQQPECIHVVCCCACVYMCTRAYEYMCMCTCFCVCAHILEEPRIYVIMRCIRVAPALLQHHMSPPPVKDI